MTRKILIGVPSYRRPELLSLLLSSLEAQQYLDEVSVRVFVADNDPDDHEGADLCSTLAHTYCWPLTACIVDQPGISSVRNAILTEALVSDVDFVAMIDDDERAEPQWLAQLLEVQEKTGADIVGGPVMFEFEEAPSLSIVQSGAFSWRIHNAGPIRCLDATGNILISTSALRRANCPAFDTGFGLTGGEDKEFFQRLLAAGLRFAWSDRAVAIETVPVSRANKAWILRRAYRIGNSDARIAWLHEGGKGFAKEAIKVAGVVGLSPFFAVLLLFRSTRLWLLRKWWRTFGKIAAGAGQVFEEYSRPSHRSH